MNILKMREEITPLVLLVDDKVNAMQSTVSLIGSLGCSVVVARSADEAIKVIMSSPSLDLVFTDVDLIGNVRIKDKSGVAVATFAKQVDNELPVFGYSSKFEDEELDEKDKENFDNYYYKGVTGIEKKEEMYNSIRSMAIKHKEKRFNKMLELFNTLNKEMVIGTKNFDNIFRLATELEEIPFRQINEAITTKGYKLVTIYPEPSKKLSKPFLVWIHNEEKYSEVEVYGYSDLFCFGDSEDEAINNLLIIMEGFLEDMRSDSEEKFIGPALKIRNFLINIFN